MIRGKVLCLLADVDSGVVEKDSGWGSSAGDGLGLLDEVRVLVVLEEVLLPVSVDCEEWVEVVAATHTRAWAPVPVGGCEGCLVHSRRGVLMLRVLGVQIVGSL